MTQRVRKVVAEDGCPNIRQFSQTVTVGGDVVSIRLQDYRQLQVAEPFDAIVSVGMSENVGSDQLGGYFKTAAGMLKPGGVMVISTLNRNWKSFALAIVGAEYVLRWLPRGTHRWDKFVTPNELANHLENNRLGITEQVRSKLRPMESGSLVVGPVARGEAEIAVITTPFIAMEPGAELVGPLPDELQQLIVYTSAIGSVASPRNRRRPGR